MDFLRLLAGEMIERAAQRRLETFLVEWLEQVVDGVNVKCLQGKLVVGRNEYDGGTFLIELGQDTEAIQFRHLDIEKNQIGLFFSNQLDGFPPIGGFAQNFDVRFGTQELQQPFARERF